MKKTLVILFTTGVVFILLGSVVNEVIQKDTVGGWGDVLGRYYTARELPPVPPPVSYERVVKMISEGAWGFLADPEWNYCHNGGTLYLDEKSPLNKELVLPIKLFVQEDLVRGSVVICAAPFGSENYSGMALFKAPDFLPYEEGWSKERYLMDEFWPRRVTVTFTLRAESERIKEVFSLSQEEDEALSAPMMITMFGPETVDELMLGMNGTNVNVYVPEGFTNRVELYTTTDLISSVWSIAVQNLIPVSTNPATWSPAFSMSNAFFRAGNMDIDSDGDGVPDARELFVFKTNPSVSDTDGDAMPDGWEVDNGLNPLSADDQTADPDHDMLPNAYEYHYGLNPNSNDSAMVPKIRVDPLNTTVSNTYVSIRSALNASEPYSVIEIAGGVYDEDNITFPAHPVMLMSDQWGTNRSVKINSSSFATFMLSDEQDNRTIIRGLNVTLEGRLLRQFGFYIGRGYAPFNGAAPFFDGVKIQLGSAEWSAGFYGLGSTDGTVRFNNCIVRGGGSSNTLSGIYLVDAPDVQIVNCSFLEFNESPDLSQGILLGASSGNIGGAASFVKAQISNCFWDDSFGTNNNYAVVHALDSSSRYQTTVSHSVVPDSSCLLDVDGEVSLIEAPGTALLDGLILSNSPCRNVSGTDLLSWYDFQGQPRDGSPDIGADEYSAISTNDTDQDGLSDLFEAFTNNTFILDYDSDGDRVGDGDEHTCGTNPRSKTNYCVTIIGAVDDQTGLNASIKASYSLGSSAWNSGQAVAVNGGQFSYPHQEINSPDDIIVQTLIDLNGNGTTDSGEPYYYQPLKITNHTTRIEFVLEDADGDGVGDYDENSCGTDPNASGNYCVTLLGTVTNQSAFSGKTYATAVLRDKTRPLSPSDLNHEDYQSISLAQVEVETNGTFLIEHVTVEPNTNDLNILWLVVYHDALTNSVLDYFEPISQILVNPTNHTMSYQFDSPEGDYDGDRDRIPDWWEAWNGLSYTNAADAFADPDGDWIDNLWEYRLGYDLYSYETNNFAFADAMRAVDTRIAGRNPTNAIHIFSENYWVTTNLTRNADCWAADIDLTMCSPFNSYDKNKRAGTLISPRHALFVNHKFADLAYWVPEGETLQFVDETNGVYTATIESVHHLVYTNGRVDLTVAVLVEDVPTNRFSFAKILPANFTNYLGHIDIHAPGPCFDQEEKARIRTLIRCGDDEWCYTTTERYEPRIPYTQGTIPGDSGNPAFIVLDSEPVLLTLWVAGGAGSSIPFFKDQINLIMSTNGYSLTEFDMSGYEEVPSVLR